MLRGRRKSLSQEDRRLIGQRWSARTRQDPPSDDGVVVFAIPLVSRKKSTDWASVCRNLHRTVNSIRNQTSDRWMIFICGQDRPDGIEFCDRIVFKKFRNPFARSYDKGYKRRVLIRTVARRLKGRDGYYAQFDADDLLHPDVVAHILQDNNGRGYLIEEGYAADLGADKFAFARPGTDGGRSRAFWRMCGSSSFVRMDFRAQPRRWQKFLELHTSHVGLVEWCAAYDMDLEPLSFPAAIYVCNNGSNVSCVKGNTPKRLAYIRDNLVPPAVADDIRDGFRLSALLAD